MSALPLNAIRSALGENNERPSQAWNRELRRGQSIARELQEEMTRSRQISRGIGLGM